MSDNSTNETLAQELANLLRAKLAQPAMPALQLGGQLPQPTNVLVPINLPLPDGSQLRCYLSFGGEIAQHPHALQAVAMQLGASWPLATYFPRSYSYQRGGRGGFGGGRW